MAAQQVYEAFREGWNPLFHYVGVSLSLFLHT